MGDQKIVACMTEPDARRADAAIRFCEGLPTDQLKPGGLRKLVEAAFDLSFKSLAGTATLEDLERIDEALAPFKGGDDG